MHNVELVNVLHALSDLLSRAQQRPLHQGLACTRACSW